MFEYTIDLKGVNPIDVFGVNDNLMDIMRRVFPSIKLIARGDMLKVCGDEKSVLLFNEKFNALLLSIERFGALTEQELLKLFDSDDLIHLTETEKSDFLLRGNNGKQIKARTANQLRMVESIEDNDLLFAIGPAGTGKTYTAVALAVRALKNKQVKRIVLTRPAVEAGESLGFLPGDMREKLDPYLQPLYDALRDMIHFQKLATYLEEGTIEVAPLAYMRGRTLNNAFVILDEAQNATPNQLKMFLTRMGQSAKFIVTGDVTQIDLPPRQQSGLVHASKILQDIPGVDFVFLNINDIVRHALVKHIITAYDKNSESR